MHGATIRFIVSELMRKCGFVFCYHICYLIRLRQMINGGSTPSFDKLTKKRPCTKVWTHRAATASVHATTNVMLSRANFLAWAVRDNALTARGQDIFVM